MTEFAKMDIFFLIASIAAVVFTILAAILLIYVIKFMRNVKIISDKARQESENISQDLQDLRDHLRTGGSGLKYAWNFFNTIIKGSKKGK